MATIQSLQVFRGLAALAVVAHHAVTSTGAFVGVVPAEVESILGMGYLGVDFFFVLSGFIIMYTHMGDSPSKGNVQRYVSKRLVRIFPPYLRSDYPWLWWDSPCWREAGHCHGRCC
jgi:exopolysaccharide production protein ExoZ